ncbi:MAG: DNA repair protein RecO [Anaerolineales bacterium]|nr:MAG: DNA repair protein RecO [Anaerolineales bacterium]
MGKRAYPGTSQEGLRWYNRRMPERERLYHAEAVILRRRDLGEADRLLTVFTREFGKLRQIAKGVRRPRSRKAGHLELFNRVRLLVARGRELDIITQAEAIESYPNLHTDLLLVGYAGYAIELLDHFTVDAEQNAKLYQLISETLERLDQGEEPNGVVRHYEVRLLDEVGFRPELFRCVACRSEVRPEAQFFSYEKGGVLCPACGGQERSSVTISLPALKVLRHFQRSTYKVAAKVAIRSSVHSELDHLMEGFLGALLERRLNVPHFIRRVQMKTPIQSKSDTIP